MSFSDFIITTLENNMGNTNKDHKKLAGALSGMVHTALAKVPDIAKTVENTMNSNVVSPVPIHSETAHTPNKSLHATPHHDEYHNTSPDIGSTGNTDEGGLLMVNGYEDDDYPNNVTDGLDNEKTSDELIEDIRYAQAESGEDAVYTDEEWGIENKHTAYTDRDGEGRAPEDVAMCPSVKIVGERDDENDAVFYDPYNTKTNYQAFPAPKSLREGSLILATNDRDTGQCAPPLLLPYSEEPLCAIQSVDTASHAHTEGNTFMLKQRTCQNAPSSQSTKIEPEASASASAPHHETSRVMVALTLDACSKRVGFILACWLLVSIFAILRRLQICEIEPSYYV